ncbi:MAG: response regulator transcription factor [Planctomycetota bacterium]
MPTTLPRILLVEDDDHIRRPLLRELRERDLSVDFSLSLEDARRSLAREYDLVLLDLGLPDGDGLELCRELRADASRAVAIILLTARDAPEQRVRGLEAGADDYVVKPFHLPELVARIRSVLRRSGSAQGLSRLSCGDVWADARTRKAGRGPRELALKRRELDLLLFLLGHRGRAWTRDQLLDRVWGPGFTGDPRTVDLHVRRLRAKIEDDPGAPRLLQTVWGVGYRMAEEDAS